MKSVAFWLICQSVASANMSLSEGLRTWTRPYATTPTIPDGVGAAQGVTAFPGVSSMLVKFNPYTPLNCVPPARYWDEDGQRNAGGTWLALAPATTLLLPRSDLRK